MSQIEVTPVETAELTAEPSEPEALHVHTGSRVTLEDQYGDELEVTLTADGGIDSVSPQSPVGKAVFGAAVGDLVTVLAPRGSWTARILSVS